MRWREGLTCPGCGGRSFCELKTRKLFQCNRCKRQVRLTAGTVFQDTKLPLTTWFAAIYHLTQSKGGVSSIELGRRLGVKQGTAWLMEHKLMRAMASREAAEPKLSGRVEVDDAYLGGERPGGKRGRGAAGKTPFVAAVETTPEREPRRLRLSVVKGFRKKEVEKLAKAAIEPGSDVVSDGLSCWPAVEKAGCSHRPMVTGSGKRAASWSPFRWVNTALGNIKTAIVGTYHHVSPRHAPSYLASYAYRFNRRRQLDSIVERLAWAAVRTAPRPYRVVTADA
jgi:transposase-like protein